ncbi:YceI family protein [Halomonas daqiaonensis]|uniref:Polyisoprenoid-binding protein YceI n=1 Tax=Halomonas daqiaonensis TaxID=650850 RepID=A0A1H7TCC9_9GAMM|nr:YceI family protein [Halomonas daqiaonensis]SEL82522.1 Polyisoprenoid-binding protein YceI [Halomonas daqiaonensis]
MPSPLHHTQRPSLPIAAGLALTLGALSMPSASAEPRTYEIDPEHFSIGFLTKHVGYADILGMFLEGQGEFVYDEQTRQLHSGNVEIAADSVFTNHEERDNHLRSDDFLDAGRYSTIVFEVTGFEAHSDSEGTLEGDLTLLGETRLVSLAVTLNKAAEYPFGHGQHTLGLSARTTIDRSDWGMNYGVDNGMVGDEVELIFELEAIRQ